MARDYPIEKTRDIGIIAHIDVPIRPTQSAVGQSRILDFAVPLSAGAKSGPEKL